MATRTKAAKGNTDRRSRFPIAAIGASAGGLQAFTALLSGLPEAPGLAIVFVLHTDSRDSTSLRDVLSRKSKMPVEIATDGGQVVINRVYIPPPGSFLLFSNGHFRVQSRDRKSATLPIDACFRSLSEVHGNRAIGVVLSGTASDGSLGTEAIKATNGITFAQDESAQSHDMPHNATLTGAIDFVLSPEQIARELVRMAKHPYMGARGTSGFADADLSKIFALLRETHEVDFTHYKKPTLERRIRRRMALHRADSIDAYVELLTKNKAEVEGLYNDILIRVTGFFRDPEVFDAVCGQIVPKILSEHASHEPIRVWVPGCATGEEVYSLAICILEATSEGKKSCPVQIFGTDINDEVVTRARAGFYSSDIEAEVSPERLQRFFTRDDGGYRVTKSVRDCCVFARQNLTQDPPFSRLDLISCRNVMIYLGTVLQRRVMSIFNYALRPSGFLLLGSSETIGTFSDLFTSIDRKNKIYVKRTGGHERMPLGFESSSRRESTERLPMEEETTNAAPNVFREADRVLLSRYSPPGVVINDRLDILQFRGRTSAFLEPAPGTATLNLLKMAREGLLPELRAAIHAARKKDAPLRREGIRVAANSHSIIANIEVIPFKTATGEQCYAVAFEEVPPETKKGKLKAAKKAEPETQSGQVQRLKRELASTSEYLQSIIEEQETMNEELRSANEEIQSSNEELQSTNEELETAKEELQSSNEELTTLNEELENRNSELAEANNDLINLLASVEIPIVMLDSEMRIRRMNPGAQRTLNLIASDVGRPIRELKMTLKDNDMEGMIRGVIEHLDVREARVQHENGQWYSLRIRPYKTMDNKIDGAVLVLIDVAGKKR